jgi:formate dehydrogenase iron-sulfur subunit
MARKMVFIDTSLCTGCKACSVACKAWNDLPAEKTQRIVSYQAQGDFTPNTWTYVRFREEYKDNKMHFNMLKLQCFHCDDPACMKACSSNAIYKTESGYTLIDKDKCIGCGYCAANCPWGVPKIDPATNKSTKCTGCIDRVENGMKPACAQICQPGAIQFGDYNEMMAKAEARVAELQLTNPKAHLYGDNLMGGTTYVYLLQDRPGAYGLPLHPTTPVSLIVWKDIVHPLGWIAIGASAAAISAGVLVNLVSGNYANRAKKIAESHDEGGK